MLKEIFFKAHHNILQKRKVQLKFQLQASYNQLRFYPSSKHMDSRKIKSIAKLLIHKDFDVYLIDQR